jgi:putative flippase GtrA
LRQLIKRVLVAELTVFGFVGIVCLVADIVLFNAFVFGLGMGPVPGKAIGLVITGAMAFFGHRHFTFARRRSPGRVGHEVGRFVVATLATVLLSLLPVYAARHVFGVTGVLGLNVANVIGIALGTVVRFLAYRYLVWTGLEAPTGTGATYATTPTPAQAVGRIVTLPDAGRSRCSTN